MPEMLSYANWVDIPHPGVGSAWADYDLDSAGCPADTVGVIVYYNRYAAKNTTVGIRANGSTDTGSDFYRANDGGTAENCRYIMICGCDVNKIIETYRTDETAWNNTSARLSIIGWIKSDEAYMLTNAVTPTWTAGGPTANSWEECQFDSAIQGGDTPLAWVLKLTNDHWNADSIQARPAGSSYPLRTSFQYESHIDTVVGAGTNNRIDIWFDDLANIYAGVQGYFTRGYTSLYDSTIDIAAMISESTWSTVNLPSIPADAVVIVENDSNSSTSRCAVREVGSADTLLPLMGSGPNVHMASVGATQQIEVYYRWGEVQITGYFDAAVPPTPPASYADLTFYFDVPITPVDLSVDWTDADPDGFTANNLPTGLSLSPQGILSGTPVCPPGTNNLSAQSIADSLGVTQAVAVTQEAPQSTYELQCNGDSIAQVDGFIMDPNSAYTFEFEVYANSEATGRAAMGSGDTDQFYIIFRPANVVGVNHWEKLTDGATYSFLTWHTCTVYVPPGSGDATSSIDGGATSAHTRGSTSTNAAPFTLFAPSINKGVNSMNGRIKNVKVWSGNKGTLIHHWPIDDNSNTIVDIVGSANGVLTIGSGSWVEIPL